MGSVLADVESQISVSEVKKKKKEEVEKVDCCFPEENKIKNSQIQSVIIHVGETANTQKKVLRLQNGTFWPKPRMQ